MTDRLEEPKKEVPGGLPANEIDVLCLFKDGRASLRPGLVDGEAVKLERKELEGHFRDGICNRLEMQKINEDLSLFEDRMLALESTYRKQGLNEMQAHGRVQEQVAQVYKEMNRLLNFKQPSLTGVNEKERLTLARQMLSNSADPTTINQGYHRTCTVAALEVRTYTLAPGQAAHLVADVALTGKYRTRDGSAINIDSGSLQPHDSARSEPPVDGGRNYASQLFQISALNIHYQRKEPRYLYLQEEPEPSFGDTGDRMVTAAEFASGGNQSWIRAWLSKLPGIRTASPKLAAADIVDIGNQIMDNGNAQWFLIHKSRDSPNVPQIESLREFEEHLQKASDEGQFPVVISVHSSHEPFYTDSQKGTMGGSGGWHSITVSDYFPGKRSKVGIDNQWLRKADHNTRDNAIELELLYKSMIRPPSENKYSGFSGY